MIKTTRLENIDTVKKLEDYSKEFLKQVKKTTRYCFGQCVRKGLRQGPQNYGTPGKNVRYVRTSEVVALEVNLW